MADQGEAQHRQGAGGQLRPPPEAITTDPSKQNADRVGEEWYDRGCLDALVPGTQEFGKGWRGLQHEGNAGRIVERADPHTTHVELAVIAKCISKFRMSMQPVIKSKVGEGEGIAPSLEVDDTNCYGCKTEDGDRRQNGRY